MSLSVVFFLSILCSVIAQPSHNTNQYTLDFSITAPYDGIGSICGAGTKLIMDYPEPYRTDILDYLFLPRYGAGIQILKMEIGGGGYSFGGSDPSYAPSSLNGPLMMSASHQWWLMQEGLKRNPRLRVVGIPYTFPAWVSSSNATAAAEYLSHWVLECKRTYNVTVYGVGMWAYHNNDPDVIVALRRSLDSLDMQRVKILAGETNSWNIAKLLVNQPNLSNAVDILGTHYPGAYKLPTADAVNAQKPLWATEDCDSLTFGCIARAHNNNMAVGNFSATIVYKLLVGSYEASMSAMDHRGLITANSPWSGAYNINEALWGFSHTTWFVDVDSFVIVKSASGVLVSGGTYVTYLQPSTGEFVIVVERSAAMNCNMPNYNTNANPSDEHLQFLLPNGTRTQHMFGWFSQRSDRHSMRLMQRLPVPIPIMNGMFSADVSSGTVMTFVSWNPMGVPSEAPTTPPHMIPHPGPLPLPFALSDNITSALPRYFVDQSGSFVRSQSGSSAIQQVAVGTPVSSSNTTSQASDYFPIMIIGDSMSLPSCYTLQVQFQFPPIDSNISRYIGVGMQLSHGPNYEGLLVAIGTDNNVFVSSKVSNLLAGDIRKLRLASPITSGVHTLTVMVYDNSASAMIDQSVLFSMMPCSHFPGSLGVVVGGFYNVNILDFKISSSR